MEFINGMMEENMLENGKLIKWMVMVNIHGLMEENIKVNIQMIKKMDMENIHGLMVENILDYGKMENKYNFK